MNKDAEKILLFLDRLNSCYKRGSEMVPNFIRPHCDNHCECCDEDDDNITTEYKEALMAAKRLTYQPCIDFSSKTRRDGMWVLQLMDLPHLYLRPGERISVNQKEFVIQKINCALEREMVRQIEIIGDFVS